MEISTDSNQVRQSILDAARAEFAARGLDGASVRTIARSAGVTAAMINYYFGGKQRLYDAVIADAQARLYARLGAAASATGSDRRDLVVRLAAAYCDFLAEQRDLQRLLLRLVLDQPARVRDGAAAMVAPLRRLLAAHLGDDDEARQHAISLFGAISGYFLYEPVLGAFLGGDPLSPQRLARRRRHVLELAARIGGKRP